ncbi:MAG: MFS transporter, partial [Rhizonema sp. PD37]|nr:MFS transporter [Rhizonema sp. PD37]
MVISVYRKSQWLFLSSQLITGIGDQLYNIAVAILVYQKTSSSLLLAITFSTSYIGVLIGYFITPYLKKRSSHTHIMRMTDLISAPLVSLIPFVPIVSIFLLIFFLGILRGINRPLSQELIPKISKNTEEIKKLNADFTTFQTLSMLGGVILSGFFVAAEQLKPILIIDGISFVICSWMTSNINLINKNQEENIFILNAKNEPFKSYIKIILHPINSFQQETILFCLLIPNSLTFGLISSYQSQLFPLLS